MTDRDPDLQRAIDHQTARWSRHLAGRVLPGIDPDRLAAEIVEGIHADGWWPHPRSDRIPQPGHRDPETARRGAQRARAALQQIRNRGETDA